MYWAVIVFSCFALYIMFFPAFFYFRMDTRKCRSQYLYVWLLEQLAKQGGRETDLDSDSLSGILGELTSGGYLSIPSRTRLDNIFTQYDYRLPIGPQLELPTKVDTAFAVASWSISSPGATLSEASRARNDIERGVRDGLRKQLPRWSPCKSSVAADAVIDAYECVARGSAHAQSRYLRIPSWLPALGNGICTRLDVLGRGVTVGLLVGFVIGLQASNGQIGILNSISFFGLLGAASAATFSLFLFAVQIYRAGKLHNLPGTGKAAVGYAVMIIAFGSLMVASIIRQLL